MMLTGTLSGGDWAGIPQFFNTLGGCPGDCNSAYLYLSIL